MVQSFKRCKIWSSGPDRALHISLNTYTTGNLPSDLTNAVTERGEILLPYSGSKYWKCAIGDPKSFTRRIITRSK